jgi:hypothetical protein
MKIAAKNAKEREDEENYKLQTLLWKRNTDYPNGVIC